jgi:hypothetical protein
MGRDETMKCTRIEENSVRNANRRRKRMRIVIESLRRRIPKKKK